MEKRTFRSKRVTAEGVTLDYVLEKENENGRAVYTLIITESGEEEDLVVLCDIAECESDAIRLFELFSSELVTPCSAPYIMDDLLALI